MWYLPFVALAEISLFGSDLVYSFLSFITSRGTLALE